MGDNISFLKRISCLVFAGCLPLWPILSSLALIPLIAIHLFFSKPAIKKRPREMVFFLIPFLGYAISFIYAYDHTEAGLYLLRISPMVIIPLLFLANDKDAIPSRQTLSSWFIYGMLISAIFAFILSGFAYLRSGNIEVFTYYDLAEQMRLHPTYYSLYALTALALLWNGKYRMSFKVLIALVFIVLILLLQSRMAFAILIALISLQIFLLSKRSRIRWLLGVLALVAITVVAFRISDRINEDMKNLGNYDQPLIGTLDQTGVTDRMWLLKEAFLQIEERPLFGYGLKSQRSLFGWKIHKKNLSEGLPVAYRDASWSVAKRNLHNQYLHVLYEGGLIGLLILIFALVLIAYKAWKIRNIPFLIAYTIFLLFMLTENILDRQMGIYFYGVLLPVLFLCRERDPYPLTIKYNKFRTEF